MNGEARVSLSMMLRALFSLSEPLALLTCLPLGVSLLSLPLLVSPFLCVLSLFPPLCLSPFLAHVSPHAPHGEMFSYPSPCLSRSFLGSLFHPCQFRSAFPDVRHSPLLYFSPAVTRGCSP